MSWPKRTLSRRAFLGGAAVTVTLPWLESLVPAHAASAAPPVRLLWWFLPNGIHMPAWTPTTDGAGYDLPPILAPLAPVQSEVSVFTGLANRSGEGDRPGDHARGTATFLTHVPISHTGVNNGISVDQLVAQRIGGATPLPSLELGVHETSTYGICDAGYSCAYVHNISWQSAQVPMPKISSARLAFERLFGGVDPSLSQAAREERMAWRTSVLDVVRDESLDLQRQLGTADRQRLDEYLTGVRELELRIEASEGTATCDPGATPPDDILFEDRARIMADLMVTAVRCDLTRVITFMLGNGQSAQSFSFLGVTGGHHEISHHQDKESNFDKLTTIGTWEIEQLAYLLQQLADTPEGDGTLLDHSLVMVGSEIGDGDHHDHHDLPVLVAGRGGGLVSPGRHVRLASERPVSDLYLAMLQPVGIDEPTFGADGTAPLTELFA